MITSRTAHDADGRSYVDLTIRFTAPAPIVEAQFTVSVSDAAFVIDDCGEATNSVTFRVDFTPISRDEVRAVAGPAAPECESEIRTDPSLDLLAHYTRTLDSIGPGDIFTEVTPLLNHHTVGDSTAETAEDVDNPELDWAGFPLPESSPYGIGNQRENRHFVHERSIDGVWENGAQTMAMDDTANRHSINANDSRNGKVLTAWDILSDADRLIVARLLRVPQRVRAMHAYLVGLFVDGDTLEGKRLRQNIVTALSASVVNPDIASHWILVPQTIRHWLKNGDRVPSEIEAVAILAELLRHENLEPAIAHYLDAVTLSFESIAGLDPPEARERLFSPADRLDQKFFAAFPNLAPGS